MTEARQTAKARKFREYWTLANDSEVGGYQKFWIDLLGDVLGAEEPTRRIAFQVPVPMQGTTKFLDAWISETKVLIEHKKKGVRLDAPQSGHGGKTPYEQACEYDNARPFEEKARWIVTCNFEEIWIYDRTRPLADPQRVTLATLPREVSRLGFLVDAKVKEVRTREEQISKDAGRIVAEIYDALLKRYACGACTEETENTETRRKEEESPCLRASSNLRVSAAGLAALNRLCVRLVFCFYAEDAEVFPKDALWRLLQNTPAPFLRERLMRLFETLDTPPERRSPYLEPELAAFPYTNGGLFAKRDDIPPLDESIRVLLIKSSDFDWRDISPTIFGALFESTLNPATRRAGGMVYTSVENIHKVIDPLFLDSLTAEVDRILVGEFSEFSENRGATRRANSFNSFNSPTKKSLLALQSKLASLTFLDPACGSGNFLTESYLSLRRLENRIIAALQQGQMALDLGDTVKVSISQFRGLEINDFAVAVAKTALWISEAKMLGETADILAAAPKYLPLHDYDGIVEGNALRLDWPRADYIMGNPPFVGYSFQSPEQKADLARFGLPGKVDYVAGWYYKAAEIGARASCPQDSGGRDARAPKCAFVSTNSICQGEQVAAVWKGLVEKYGLEIDFAHRTFRWDSESFEKAHVHCVIVGFHSALKTLPPTAGSEKTVVLPPADGRDEKNAFFGSPPTAGREKTVVLPPAGGRDEKNAFFGSPPTAGREKTSLSSLSSLKSLESLPKTLYDGPRAIPAAHINAYLMAAPDVWVESRTAPLSPVPKMTAGNRPADGGHLIIEENELSALLAKEPAAKPFIKRLVGSEEFINGKKRYCLWLKDATPSQLLAMPQVMKRVTACREARLASPDAGRRKLADTPHLFRETVNPEHCVVVPKVSSEKRQYVPIDFLDADTICSDLLFIIPEATLYHFGVLTSSVHMAWMRAVAGRLESRYRYSANIVYNNFPWPSIVRSEELGVRSCGDPSPGTATPNSSLLTPNLRSCIEQTAQAVLDARARYPDCTFAQLYGPQMYLFPELVAAHRANDAAVLAAYGFADAINCVPPEEEIVAHLFNLYAELTA